MATELLEQLHRRLENLADLRTIVRTMKALAAASIRQYEQASDALAVYDRTIEFALQVVLREKDPATATAPESLSAGRAAVVFGSDHGLCGRFNEEILEHALPTLHGDPASFERPHVIAVGARVAAALGHAGFEPKTTLETPAAADQITVTVQRILLLIDEWQTRSGGGRVRLYFNRHSGIKGYEPTGLTLLPMETEHFRRLHEKPWPGRSLPIYTMDPDLLLKRLLRQYLFVSIFRACAESQAGEHASRLAAMQSAERNLDNRHAEVGSDYRRARQDAITSELLDVISGFEATGARPNVGRHDAKT